MYISNDWDGVVNRALIRYLPVEDFVKGVKTVYLAVVFDTSTFFVLRYRAVGVPQWTIFSVYPLVEVPFRLIFFDREIRLAVWSKVLSERIDIEIDRVLQGFDPILPGNVHVGVGKEPYGHRVGPGMKEKLLKSILDVAIQTL